MSFTTIPTEWLDVGDPVKKEILDRVKSNQDDLNSRLEAIEAGSGKIVLFNELILNAATLSSGGTITGLDLYRVESNFLLTDCKIWIFEKGTLGGTLEIDVQVSSSADFTTSNSVFTTKPSVAYATASDYDESSNTVFSTTYQNVSIGDYLRLDVSELPSGGSIGKFGIFLIGELA